MLYFDEIKEKYGHDIANVVAGSLEELQTDGFEITSYIVELAVSYYQNNSAFIENMSSLTEKRRHITKLVQEAK